MLSAGIDIGSRTIALVVSDGKEIVQSAVVDTGFDPVKKAAEWLRGKGILLTPEKGWAGISYNLPG